jgi:formate hydrogenlyase subunit 3/multisubunit Na+/H+ antiporter MnhD subunit
MMKFLPLILVAIPLLGCVLSSLKRQNFFLRLFDSFLPIIFFANLVGVYRQVENHGAFVGFHLDKTTLIFLFLLGFLWLVFAFYSQRFWQLNSEKRSQELRIFVGFVVAILTAIFLGKNLLLIFFFYSCLILGTQLFAVRFLRHTEVGFLRLFTFLLYFESFFFFLALVATSKFMEGSTIENLTREKGMILLFLYFFGLFFSVLVPYFIFFRKPNIEPIITYVFFFLAYSFGSICIFVKLLILVFGLDFSAKILAGNGFTLLEIIFFFNILVASILTVFSRGIKLSFFYLFFQQLFFVIFSIIFFATFKARMVYLGLISFSLSLTLIFFCVSNITLYLSKSSTKSLIGLFYQLPINTTLLIFSIASMAGLIPTIGAIEKFQLIKIIWQKHLWISASIIAINSTALTIFAGKMFYHFISRLDEDLSEENLICARNIDFDSSLVLTSLLTAIIILSGLFITKII